MASSLTPIGVLPQPGASVEAKREEDEEYEPATVKGVDMAAGTIQLRFEDGFQASVPLTQVKLAQPPAAAEGTVAEPAAADPSVPVPLVPPGEDEVYDAEVRPTLATIPTAEALAADPEAKYGFIAASKDAGNALFKQGKYAWAIRTYCEGVDALASCYASRERMLWDYLARGPSAQCYSNAALCALKLEEHGRAAALCDAAMACKPEDDDLLKVLLRHGQALSGLGELQEAKERLERGVDKAPSNRPLREELQKVKKALLAQAKANEARLFQGVDLASRGLTSKKDAFSAQLEATLQRGMELVYDGKDEAALRALAPLLDGRLADEEKHRGALLQAAYGAGVAAYHLGQLADAVTRLARFFELREGRDDLATPPSGVPLARFYLGHACFNTGRHARARETLETYLAEAEAAGPQPVLNMPDGWQGKKISDADRKASRFRHRAASGEAQSDAHMMLALVAQREALEGDGAARPAAAEACAAHCAACVRKAGTDKQRLGAHQEAARMHRSLGRDAEAEAELAAAAALERTIAEKEAAEAAKKAEEAKNEYSAKDAPVVDADAEGAAEGAMGALAAAAAAGDGAED